MTMRKGLILWCQFIDCGVGYAPASIGLLPLVCPMCQRETIWKTTRPWTLTHNDCSFLKRIGVDAETTT